METCYNEAHIN